jgi:V/A-type H+-transporting ATPase subunit I
MLLYLGMIYAGYRLFTTGTPGIIGWIALTAPMLLILGYKWVENTSSFGERIIIVLIEGFETIMSYISNTLSFLRVAAFSLNHVALAIAVFTLGEMMDTTGYWITVVLGNIFILVLEGAIVAIQVLRLEYYEGFSRFFSGSGREFRPLTLDNVNSQQI